MQTLIARIDALLPQTQCEKCGHPGCLPYAEAVANGEAHNKCPPGRQETSDALARLLGRPSLPLEAKPVDTLRRVAVIREAECIGCTKCIDACPVDAIVGARLLMHTVIAAECTGCDLCLPPCPVDCIDILVLADQTPEAGAPARARRRHLARQERLGRDRDQRQARGAGSGTAGPASTPAPAAPSAGSASPPPLAQLRTQAAIAQRQVRDAAQALARAQRAGKATAEMRERLLYLESRAAAAQAAFAAAQMEGPG